MNKKFTIFALAMFSTFAVKAQQVISEEVTLGTSNDVYYNLSNQLKTPTDRTDWDISFYRKSLYSAGIRINDAAGIKLYEVSDDFSKWNDVNINDQSSWDELYNSDTSWVDGAFNQGSDDYGWGYYEQIPNHIVKGTVVFVLKYTDNKYVKLKINDLTYGVYNFTYSKWENGAWSNDITTSVDNASSPNTIFTYYSILKDQITKPEPSQDNWDLKFTKYITPIQTSTGVVPYSVTGVLQSDLIQVAKTEEGSPTDNKEYLSAINTIGYNWKTGSGNYTMVKRNHFIKNTSTNKIYKLIFKSFEGGSSAKTTFDYEDVTSTLGISDIEKTKFGIYTDVNQPKTISIIYNSQEASSSNIAVAIYSINGQLVHQENYKPTGSFTNKSINLSRLSAGVYIVKLQSGDKTESKKVVLR
ncbi:T9SS type A sorting domain-containing protein [Chishuiella sp.]|uniref:T9SS type A sorting domain-containing protein n=1 Tax=Chishuiella sp. TaxID=1969467 RepID=UPI0028B1DCCE|nr:T9SS type A sorting domain-containing protein [Chishuiella sp.]